MNASQIAAIRAMIGAKMDDQEIADAISTFRGQTPSTTSVIDADADDTDESPTRASNRGGNGNAAVTYTPVRGLNPAKIEKAGITGQQKAVAAWLLKHPGSTSQQVGKALKIGTAATNYKAAQSPVYQLRAAGLIVSSRDTAK